MINMEKIIYKSDIVEYKNFLTGEECEEIIKLFNENTSLWQQSCFYKSDVIDPGSALQESSSKLITKEYLNSIIQRIKILGDEVSGKKLINLTFSGHRWHPGSFASKHSDNTELDGTPNAWRDNKYATLIYLNEDYEGGELVFDEHNIQISPGKGSLMIFDPGFHNLHSVNEITNGIRYTILSSWNFENEYDRSEHEKLLKEREKMEEQKELQRQEWERGIVR